jgi:hypothetical protein
LRNRSIPRLASRGRRYTHIVISRYAGAAEKAEAALPKVRQEFVPLVKGCEGFLCYATLPTEQGDVVACLIWEDAGAMAASRDKIRTWAQANLQGFESRRSGSWGR